MDPTEQRLLAEFRAIARRLKRRAASGISDGDPTPSGRAYLANCSEDHPATGTSITFTRCVGFNEYLGVDDPNFERYLHLSLSFWSADDEDGPMPTSRRDEVLCNLCATAFFGDDDPHTWIDLSQTSDGRALDVWHWYLFCDADWQPIILDPATDTSHLTSIGWRNNAVQVHDEREILNSLDLASLGIDPEMVARGEVEVHICYTRDLKRKYY